MSRKTRQRMLRDELPSKKQSNKNNVIAMHEGALKSKWTKHDILQIQPLTENQHTMFQCYYQGSHIIAHGSPGTGKTFLALYLATMDMVDRELNYKQIKIIRSIVPTREVGHLPGDIDEKVSVYEEPYISIYQHLCKSPTTYSRMKESKFIEFVPTSFIRGSTWDDTLVIIDEAQNMTWHEINSVITRIGTNSRLIITGDTKQCDLVRKNDISGFAQAIDVASTLSDDFAIVQFKPEDIVRSEFVRNWIMACEKHNL